LLKVLLVCFHRSDGNLPGRVRGVSGGRGPAGTAEATW